MKRTRIINIRLIIQLLTVYENLFFFLFSISLTCSIKKINSSFINHGCHKNFSFSKNVERYGSFSYYQCMKLIKYILEDPLYSKIVKWVLSALVATSIFLAIYFTSDRSIISACNSTFIPGVIMIGIAFFSFINYFGGFDFAEYGFISGINSLKKGSPIEYDDLIDYKTKKKISRKNNPFVFLPYAVYGIIYLIAALVLFLIYKSSI